MDRLVIDAMGWGWPSDDHITMGVGWVLFHIYIGVFLEII